MTIEDLRGKRILILGYGIEGKETEQYIKKHIPDATIGIADQQQNPNYLVEQKNYDVAIKSPGIKKELVTIPYTTATNLFFSNVKGITIGVTGTKGKSTTTSLIYHILKTAGFPVHLAGNIGRPMLEVLEKTNNDTDIFVLELSSYQLADIQFSPHISVGVSLYPDHLDYHGTLEEYYEAKHNIMRFASADDLFVYNPAFPEFVEWASKATCRTQPYTDIQIDDNESPLIGEHNKQNMRAAYTVAQEFGVPEEIIRQAFKTFTPLRHRLQNVGTFNKITFYDDAISTTPESTIKAIEALKNVGLIMLGGLDRGYDFSPLIEAIRKYNIRNFVFFPHSGSKILGMLKEGDTSGITFLETQSMEEAVQFAYKTTPPHTICLLSTASPSYSVWKNFEEKGDQFQTWVKQYGQSEQRTEKE